MHDQAATLRMAVGGGPGSSPAFHRQTALEGLHDRFERGRTRVWNSLEHVPEDEPDDGLSTPDINQPLAVPGAH